MGTVEYKLSQIGVQRMSDGVFIPSDSGNKDWIEYLKWTKAGGKVSPLSSDEDLASEARRWRDAEIESLKWLRERHRDEIDSNRPTTLNAEQSGELLDYVQALRDWPLAEDFPAGERPQRPAWIDTQSM